MLTAGLYYRFIGREEYCTVSLLFFTDEWCHFTEVKQSLTFFFFVAHMFFFFLK